MNSLSRFFAQMDWWGLVWFLLSVAAALFCFTFHELSHAFVAYRLGDPTAKNAGRLTLNPLRHIDIIGLLMMLVARVGWAKPVPVDMRYFKNPKWGMTITALAGPISNILLAFLALGLGSLLFWFAPETEAVVYLVLFLCYLAVLSTGMGMFNLIPIPPLDGSRLVSALLPDKIYVTLMRYERYILFLVLALAWFGVFSKPVNFCVGWVLEKLSLVTRFPFSLLQYYFGF